MKLLRNGAKSKASVVRWGADDSTLFFLSEKDRVTVGDSFSGMFPTGQSGSGKTTGFLQAAWRAMCRQGFGIIATTTKVGDALVLSQWAKAERRGDDVLIFSPEQPWRIGLLDYAFHQKGSRGAADTDNVVALLSELLEFKNRGAQQGGDSVFWYESARKVLGNTIDVLAYSGEVITFAGIYKVLQSIPYSLEEVKQKKWQTGSFLNQTIDKAVANKKLTQVQQNDLALAVEFFFSVLPRMDEKLRSGILATLDSIIYPFMRGRLAELAGGAESTICPEDTFRGKIIILDVPIKEYHQTGQFIQVLFLRLWQQAVEKRDLRTYPRPLALVCDEAQYFVSRHFALFQATARSQRVCSVLATQTLDSLESQLGKSDTQALISNFNLKCFCASDDVPTNTWASKMIGESWELSGNTNVSFGGEGNTSGGASEQLRYLVPISDFVKLKRGGKENGGLVECICFRSGKPFVASGTNHLRVSFPQNY